MSLFENFIDINLLLKKIDKLKEFLYKEEFNDKKTFYKNRYNQVIISINYEPKKLHKNTIKIYDNKGIERIAISYFNVKDNLDIYLSDSNGKFILHQSYLHTSNGLEKKYTLSNENIENKKYTYNSRNNNFLCKLLPFNIKHFMLDISAIIDTEKTFYNPFYNIVLDLKKGIDYFIKYSSKKDSKTYEINNYSLKLELLNMYPEKTQLQYVFFYENKILFILELYNYGKYIKFKNLNLNNKNVIKFYDNDHYFDVLNYNFDVINDLIKKLNNKESIIYKKDKKQEKIIENKNNNLNLSTVIDISYLFSKDYSVNKYSNNWILANPTNKQDLDKIKLINF